jgi:hypothetical protein
MTPTPPPAGPRPTVRQLSYLRALAERTGQSFSRPHTRAQASREIQRLKAAAPSTPLERKLERHDWAAEAAAREANCDVPIDPDAELEGYLATASWRRR